VSRGVLLCALEASCSRLRLRGTWTSRLWDCLRSTGAAGTNEELDNEGWSGWSAGTASVWEALVRSQQSGRSSTRSSIRRTRRRNGPLPVGSCSIYRYLAECLRAWVRNQVICRYVLPHRLPYSHPFLRPPSSSAYFPSDCHPRGSRNGTPRYVLCRERSLSPYHIYTHTHTHAYIRTQRTRSPLRTISSGFHPLRIDITRSATSTLKPLSTFSLSRPLDETLDS